jgi:nucleoside-diphosphate-sugar epimerase
MLVVDTGLQADVKTYTLMSPTIFGVGTGHFNKLSIQVPFFMRVAVEAKHAQVIGEGASTWSDIHIDDLSDFYEFLISKILSDEDVPHGKKGIYFTETGEHTWMEVSKAVAKAGLKLGALPTEEVEKLSLEQAAEKWVGGNLMFTELGFASK